MPDVCGVGPCSQELQGLEEYESPYVEDDELLCRGAREGEFKLSLVKGPGVAPGTKERFLKAPFISAKELAARQLSVWRARDVQALPEVHAILAERGQVYENVLAARAGEVRSVSIEEAPRTSVVNDTRVDLAGGHHLRHAAIAPCVHLPMPDSEPAADPIISDLRTTLSNVFRTSGIHLSHPKG